MPKRGDRARQVVSGDSRIPALWRGCHATQRDLLLFDAGNSQSLVRVPVTTGPLLPLFFTPPAITLPPTPVDAVSAPQTISVRNFDSISTTVNGYRLSSPDFEVTEFTCTGPLASGATCQIVGPRPSDQDRPPIGPARDLGPVLRSHRIRDGCPVGHGDLRSLWTRTKGIRAFRPLKRR
jgi:hypothetical protein